MLLLDVQFRRYEYLKLEKSVDIRSLNDKSDSDKLCFFLFSFSFQFTIAFQEPYAYRYSKSRSLSLSGSRWYWPLSQPGLLFNMPIVLGTCIRYLQHMHIVPYRGGQRSVYLFALIHGTKVFPWHACLT